jgi:ribonuclease HI
MELTAVIEGWALKRPCEVTLYLDSQYVRKGITEWIPAGRPRAGAPAAKQPVKNVDLWQKLDALVAGGGHRSVALGARPRRRPGQRARRRAGQQGRAGAEAR